MDGPVESVVDEQGDQAAVIEMGMGQDQGIDGPGIEVKGFTLQPVYRITALVHAAIEQDAAQVFGFQQVTGAGDLLCSAKKSQGSHYHTPAENPVQMLSQENSRVAKLAGRGTEI